MYVYIYMCSFALHNQMWSKCLGKDISQGYENEQADIYGLFLVLWVWGLGQRAETPTF